MDVTFYVPGRSHWQKILGSRVLTAFETMHLGSASSVQEEFGYQEGPDMKDVLKEAAKTGERVVDRLAASKEAVADAFEDTRHFVIRTRRTVRDLLGDAKYNIKRFPLRSVGIAFGAGAIVGVLISRSAGRR
jgi:ElaB/YqjD/DUF883 family membrane-anchored ribosome-binding protein